MTVHPHRLSQPRRFSHHANGAGAPLPLIPRRTTSRSPITSSFSFPKLSSSDSSFTTSLSSIPPPPRCDSDSSSSSSSPSNGIRPTIYSKTLHSYPAESTHSPKSTSREFPKEGRLVRKKSGQLVKSSLKSSKSATRNSLSVVTLPQSSKSEPTTPMQKAVHFDAQLEHVKLFLAEQKPLAVSRDGSPTDDTSGTDSDFPKFIYGENHDGRSRKKLLMQLCNMPSTINPNSDVALESLSLTPDGLSILGRVRVRNIAFSKWVAIRFTFDSWQTTSEVTGRYVESINSEFDKFSFTIRLNDLLARIEGKTFVMAIRYSVAGQDIWDNNDGQNYLATFTKCKAEATRPPTLSDEEACTDMADLRSKLERVSQSDDRSGPAFLAQPQRQSTPADPDMTSFRTSPSFASRYDFAASLKSPWGPSKSPPIHARNQSFPLTGLRTSPSLIRWPQKSSIDVYSPTHSPVPTKPSMGSPRDIGDDAFCSVHHQHKAVEDDIHIRPYTPRNYRGGYFDLTHANSPHPSPATFRRTPTGSIQKVSSDNRASPPLEFSSFSPMDKISRQMSPLNGNTQFIVDTGGDSELSTPSLFTPSSSRSSTPSPTEIFMSPHEDAQSLSPNTHYRQFINKYVIYVFFSSHTHPSL